MRIGYERAFVIEVLKSMTTFEGCSREDLELLADAVEGRSLIKTGDALCTEGEAADRWWVVISGRADVVANGSSVGSIGQYETVGELALFDDQPRSATITATEDLDVFAFEKANFLEVIRSSPALAVTLLRSAARRLRATNSLL
jgi:CRP/FNR family transcriptional regulator, cyclic AMP receptor protein